MFVYMIVNRVNGKYYVGKTTKPDLNRYLQQKFYEANRGRKTRSHLFAAIRKYGRENFTIHPLMSTLKTDAELCRWETEMIALMNAQDPNVGYNICAGGEGSAGHTGWLKGKKGDQLPAHVKRNLDAARVKSRAARTGMKDTPEVCAKRAASRTGKLGTPEGRKRMSEASFNSTTHRNRGKQLSDAEKQKIGESNRKGWTPERRAAWSEYKKQHNGMKGKPAWNRRLPI